MSVQSVQVPPLVDMCNVTCHTLRCSAAVLLKHHGESSLQNLGLRLALGCHLVSLLGKSLGHVKVKASLLDSLCPCKESLLDMSPMGC